MELDDILSGKEPEKIEPPKEETPETTKDQPRAPDGKFAKDEPKEAAPVEAKDAPKEAPKDAPPPKEEMTPKEKAAFAKAADETRKRQALEREIAELRKAQAPAAPAQPAEAKTFWDDPEGNLTKFGNEITQQVIRTKLDTFEAMARQRHEDFGDKVAKFGELMTANPSLRGDWLGSSDPAEYAYQMGREALEREKWNEVGGMDGWMKKKEAEITAKVEADFKAKEEERKKLADGLPSSLSNVQGKGNNPAPVWGGPASLDSILKH